MGPGTLHASWHSTLLIPGRGKKGFCGQGGIPLHRRGNHPGKAYSPHRAKAPGFGRAGVQPQALATRLSYLEGSLTS